MDLIPWTWYYISHNAHGYVLSPETVPLTVGYRQFLFRRFILYQTRHININSIYEIYIEETRQKESTEPSLCHFSSQSSHDLPIKYRSFLLLQFHRHYLGHREPLASPSFPVFQIPPRDAPTQLDIKKKRKKKTSARVSHRWTRCARCLSTLYRVFTLSYI